MDKLYLSTQRQIEFDCKQERSRVVYLSFHSGQMGSGDVIYAADPKDTWAPVSPGSVNEGAWKIACKRR